MVNVDGGGEVEGLDGLGDGGVGHTEEEDVGSDGYYGGFPGVGVAFFAIAFA